MQQDADFITADFLDMFWASSAHHRECEILTQQPPVQVFMVAGGSSLRYIRDKTVQEYKILTQQPPVQVVTVAGGSSLCHIRDKTVSSLIWLSDFITADFLYMFRGSSAHHQD